MEDLETDSLEPKVTLEATVLLSNKTGICNDVDILGLRGGCLLSVPVSFINASEEVS